CGQYEVDNVFGYSLQRLFYSRNWWCMELKNVAIIVCYNHKIIVYILAQFLDSHQTAKRKIVSRKEDRIDFFCRQQVFYLANGFGLRLVEWNFQNQIVVTLQSMIEKCIFKSDKTLFNLP